MDHILYSAPRHHQTTYNTLRACGTRQIWKIWSLSMFGIATSFLMIGDWQCKSRFAKVFSPILCSSLFAKLFYCQKFLLYSIYVCSDYQRLFDNVHTWYSRSTHTYTQHLTCVPQYLRRDFHHLPVTSTHRLV